MNMVTVKDAIQAWFETVTGVTSIWADQNAPRPAYPYGLLNITAETGVGVDEKRYTYSAVDGGMQVDVVGNRLFTINCQVLNSPSGDAPLGHNATAQYYLSQARSSLGKDTVLATLALGGVAFQGHEGTRNLSEAVNGHYISRGSMDIMFRVAETEETDTTVTYIESVEISGGFEGPVPPGSYDFSDEEFGG